MIGRLDAVRGKGMAAKYSWSCKRYLHTYPSIELRSISRSVYYRTNIVFIHKATMQCRSYKTGFVWHDLSADDLLLPTQGTEYVLKGSELPFDHSKPLPMPGINSMNHEQL